jgi:hypothetical protein
MDRAAMEWARKTVIALDTADLSPAAVIFLLRSYVTDGLDAVRDAAEQGLTHGLAIAPPSDACTRLEWLRTFREAAYLSDEDRLRDIVEQTLPDAVDALEALVRRSYEPGEGLIDAGCGEHMQLASALLAAFDLCGRLPYAMLAEELVQHARRLWWRDVINEFDAGFGVNCSALHVLCGLAGLHADADYRRAAVLAPVASYVDDARRLAASLSGRADEHPQHAAGFGRALLEWFALEPNLH